MVRSESLVALPCGPSASANSGKSSRFRSYLPIPLYVSPRAPREKPRHPERAPDRRARWACGISTETKLITSTTALICGKPFPGNHAPQQSLRRPAIARGIFSQRLVCPPRGQNRRRFQHCLAQPAMQRFPRAPPKHLAVKRLRRSDRLHRTGDASERCRGHFFFNASSISPASVALDHQSKPIGHVLGHVKLSGR